MVITNNKTFYKKILKLKAFGIDKDINDRKLPGKYNVKMLNDGWTAVTKDRSLSAQFEHSLAVTDDGYEIFTLSPKGYTKPPYA